MKSIKKKVNDFKTWKNFAKRSVNHSKKFKTITQALKKDNNLIGYGASARSSTLLNFCGINNKILDKIIDKNKLKKNQYTPGSNIKIIDYDEIIKKVSNFKLIVVLAWNFKSEIVRDLKKNGFKGKFLLPLPNKIKIL